MLRLLSYFLFFSSLLSGCNLSPIVVDNKKITNERITTVAKKWVGKHFNYKDSEQCANFVREVLTEACGKHFSLKSPNVLQAKNPWDEAIVTQKHGASFGPSYADSLAGDEIGERVSLKQLMPGDLVFLERTYEKYGAGVISHIGIYVGDGEYIDRSGAHRPVEQGTFEKSLFYGALRLHPKNCN